MDQSEEVTTTFQAPQKEFGHQVVST
jgi:hypothetical protein